VAEIMHLTHPGDIVRQRREELGLSQVQLAGRINYRNPNFITMIEKKRSRVPLYVAPKMAKALDLDPMWFIERVMSLYEEGEMSEKESFLEAARVIFKPENMIAYAERKLAGDYDPRLS
jgi:transcriptional regulator with XRE-family HTH domain